MNGIRLWPLLTVAALGWASCATPIMPTGGPADRTPPVLLASEPASDAVNVRANELTLEFSKHIEEASLRQAIAVTPEFDTPPDVRVRGRLAVITFPQDLSDNTTYVITLGTELRDLRNNRIREPIVIAFATGPQLDEGRIEGWVREHATGEGRPGVQIFAYVLPSDDGPLPDPRVDSPAYRTETGSNGTFRLDYLRDAPFFVVAVEDRNRNRRADPGEPFAAPFEPMLRPGADDEVPLAPFFLSRPDTTGPEPLRVRPRSNTEVAVRFTEAVVLDAPSPTDVAVVDSLTGRAVGVRSVYPDEDLFQIVLETEPMAANPHSFRLVRAEAVRDSAGNPAQLRSLSFTPASERERPAAEIVRFEPAGSDTLRTLRQGEVAAVVFSRPPTRPPAEDRIRVLGDEGSTAAANVETEDGVRYTIGAPSQRSFTVTVRQPDSLHVVTYRPLPADSLGDITGSVQRVTADGPVIIELIGPDDYVVRTTMGADSTFVLRGVPEGVYRLRAFVDLDGDGSWSTGLLAPYREPEPLVIRSDIRVRARWETEIEPLVVDPLHLPSPTAAQPGPGQPPEAADRPDLPWP